MAGVSEAPTARVKYRLKVGISLID